MSAREFSDVIVFPFAAAGDARRDLWRTHTDRALARLSRDVRAAFAHCAGAADVAPAEEKINRG
jgi:hypothetical protein